MLPKPTDLLLKHKVELYNNMASSGDCTGRLQARLQVFPSPRIVWEFESLGDTVCEPDDTDGKLKNPLVGSWFSIDEPLLARRGWGTLVKQPRVNMEGVARKACYGELNAQANSFRFYLPNARFQEISLEGQKWIEKYRRVESEEKKRDIDQGTDGRFVTVPIDDTWNIHLETAQEALNWLATKQENVGTLITTMGQLWHPKENDIETKEAIEAPTLSMDEALSKIATVTSLLSFANGGYLGPLYVEGIQRNGEDLEFSANILSYRTTPLEQLGATWLTIESNLETYLKCYSVFDRMSKATPWIESFNLVLAWYFQAIQPQSAQIRGKPWPIIANAVGAALERLGVTILVKELNIRGLRNSTQRTKCLLERIGISESKGYNDTNDVQTFVGIRNDATHPISTNSLSDYQIDKVLNRAIQWVEEILLWRLGYSGKYRDRTKNHYAFIEPRYDLSMRDPSW